MMPNDLRGVNLAKASFRANISRSFAHVKMAATRLRKTFQYPEDDSDDDDTPRDMDEEGGWKQVIA